MSVTGRATPNWKAMASSRLLQLQFGSLIAAVRSENFISVPEPEWLAVKVWFPSVMMIWAFPVPEISVRLLIMTVFIKNIVTFASGTFKVCEPISMMLFMVKVILDEPEVVT